MLNTLFVPRGGEQAALGQKFIGESANARIAKTLAVVGSKFGEQSPRAILPIRDQSSCSRIEEDEAQQIAR